MRFINLVAFFSIGFGFVLCSDPIDVVWRESTSRNVLSNYDKLSIFCYQPKNEIKSLSKMWKSVNVFVKTSGAFDFYKGDNDSHVESLHRNAAKAAWISKYPYWREKSFYLPPFQTSSIGVVSKESYSIELTVKEFNLFMFLGFVSGMILFLASSRLSRNSYFHYSSGVTLGIVTSALILAFIIGKFIPSKKAFYGLMFAGVSFGAYVGHYVYDNVMELFEIYRWYVLIYVITTGLISFFICYYKGPVSNPRLLTIFQWGIQIVSVFIMVMTSQIYEVTIALVIFLFLAKVFNVRLGCFDFLARMWSRTFPPKIKLLTEEEYEIQGIVETERALDELRKYCRSPDCNAWDVISRIKHPERFSGWVAGKQDHLSHEEIYEHESSFSDKPTCDFDDISDSD